MSFRLLTVTSRTSGRALGTNARVMSAAAFTASIIGSTVLADVELLQADKTPTRSSQDLLSFIRAGDSATFTREVRLLAIAAIRGATGRQKRSCGSSGLLSYLAFRGLTCTHRSSLSRSDLPFKLLVQVPSTFFNFSAYDQT